MNDSEQDIMETTCNSAYKSDIRRILEKEGLEGAYVYACGDMKFRVLIKSNSGEIETEKVIILKNGDYEIFNER